MVIDFSGGITESRVQQMIDDALDFTTGVLNLSNATAEQVQEAFTDPDRWLFSVDWSGSTYLEQYRTLGNSGNSYTIFFYVMGAQPSQSRKKILDVVIRARVTPSTGAVVIDTTPYDYAPDIIYDFDQMNSAQTAIVFQRMMNDALKVSKERFTAVWTYNGNRYQIFAGYYSGGSAFYLPGAALVSTTMPDFELDFDILGINSDGSIFHNEYTSNIQLTKVQP